MSDRLTEEHEVKDLEEVPISVPQEELEEIEGKYDPGLFGFFNSVCSYTIKTFFTLDKKLIHLVRDGHMKCPRRVCALNIAHSIEYKGVRILFFKNLDFSDKINPQRIKYL